jgi:hypothetical protein
MVIADINRESYFSLEIELLNLMGLETKKLQEKIETNIDIVLESIVATNKLYKFKSEKELIDDYETSSLRKNEFTELLSTISKRTSYQLESQQTLFEGDSGKDLKLFKKKENWFAW